MIERLLLALALFLPACSESISEAGQPVAVTDESATAPALAAPSAIEPAAVAPAPAEDDCSLSTPLVPGIPGSPGNLIVSERNPNGDSELAVLMRRFVDDLREARAAMAAGGSPERRLYETHRRMRCSWPTKPEERNEEFDARAQSYLEMVRAFDDAPSASTYDAVINSCMSCHTVSCGGPLDLIESMRWN